MANEYVVSMRSYAEGDHLYCHIESPEVDARIDMTEMHRVYLSEGEEALFKKLIKGYNLGVLEVDTLFSEEGFRGFFDAK